MSFKEFKRDIENLIDDLFHGALSLGNNEDFSDLIENPNLDDTKLFWEEGLQKIYRSNRKK